MTYNFYCRFSGILFLGLLIVMSSCNESSTVGSGIVDIEDIIVKEITLPVELIQSKDDSLLYFDPSAAIRSQNLVLLGQIEDGVFGKMEADFYMQFVPASIRTDFDYQVIDSVVLQLAYDSLNSYGKTGVLHDLSIFELKETMYTADRHYTSASFETEDLAMVSVQETAKLGQDLIIQDTVEAVPHLRIQLPISLGERILAMDSSQIADIDVFKSLFKGLHIKENSPSQQIIGIYPYNSSPSISSIVIYYRTNENEQANFVLQAESTGSTVVAQHINHDYAGSKAEMNIQNPNDSSFYIQGNGGLAVDFKIPELKNLSDVLINRAELIFYLDQDAVDYASFPAVDNIVLLQRSINGFYELLAENANGGYSASLDTSSENSAIVQYSFNIPLYSQLALEGKVFEPTVRLRVSPVLLNPKRSVLFGNAIAANSVRLKLIYTEK